MRYSSISENTYDCTTRNSFLPITIYLIQYSLTRLVLGGELASCHVPPLWLLWPRPGVYGSVKVWSLWCVSAKVGHLSATQFCCGAHHSRSNLTVCLVYAKFCQVLEPCWVFIRSSRTIAGLTEYSSCGGFTLYTLMTQYCNCCSCRRFRMTDKQTSGLWQLRASKWWRATPR